MDEISPKNKIIGHIAKFSLGTAIKGVGQFVNQYLAALLLGPAIYGLWEGIKLILGYSSCVGFGSLEGMHREIPILRGKSDEGKIESIQNISFTFNLLATILLSFALFAITFFIKVNPQVITVLRFTALIVLVQFFRFFYDTWLKANNKFDIVSRMAVIEGIGLMVSVVLIFFFSFLGFLIGYTFSIFISSLYAYFKSNFQVRLKWNSKILKSIITIGFPIMIISISSSLFQTIDRVLILKFLDTKSLGLYSIGWLVFMPVMFIFYSANSVMFPRFGERFGITCKDGELKKFIVLPIKILSLLTSILIGAISIALPIAIPLFLPAYVGGITTSQILLFGLFFAYSVGMVGNFFLVTNRQYLYFLLLLTGVLINLVLDFFFLKLGWGIIGVAFGASISYFVFFLMMIFLAMKYCEMEKKEVLKFIGEVLSPLIYVFLITMFITRFINFGGLTLFGGILNIFLKEVFFLFLVSYLIYLLFKKLEINKNNFLLWLK
jgi:O-antigen/teichoic acid export membrane protein